MNKTFLLLLPISFMMFGCAPKPEEALQPLDELFPSETSEQSGSESDSASDSEPPTPKYYMAKLDSTNSGLTTDDLAETINVNVPTTDNKESYSFTISQNAYLKNVENDLQEIILKDSCYICSNSDYQVNRLIVDFYGKKGTNFTVYNNKEGTGSGLAYHESSIEPIDAPSGGVVYEYAIDGTDWMIKNTASPYKSGFYSITVVFSK